LPLKTGVFEVVPVTTSTLLVVKLSFALVATTISFLFKTIPSFVLTLHKVTAAALYLSMPEAAKLGRG
jgi:hypothetical protein